MSANYFTVGPSLKVSKEEGTYTARCPLCPGFTAAADEWDDLFRLVAEFHAGPEATHLAWTMIAPWERVSGVSVVLPDQPER